MALGKSLSFTIIDVPWGGWQERVWADWFLFGFGSFCLFPQPLAWRSILNLPALWEMVDLYLYLQPWWMQAFCAEPEQSWLSTFLFVSFFGGVGYLSRKMLTIRLLLFLLQWNFLKCQEECLAMGTHSILIWPGSKLLSSGQHLGIQWNESTSMKKKTALAGVEKQGLES